jgi:hypothetical protein
MTTFTKARAAEMNHLREELEAIVTKRWNELGSFEAWTESDQGLCFSPRVRQIGEQFSRLENGDLAMFWAVERMSNDLAEYDLTLSDAFRSEINHAWNGIGNWQA